MYVNVMLYKNQLYIFHKNNYMLFFRGRKTFSKWENCQLLGGMTVAKHKIY